MSRSPRTRTCIGVAAVIAFVTALLFVVGNPVPADAQDPTAAAVTLTVSPVDATQPFRTLALALDAGDSGVAALGATVRFDTDQIVASSCAVSEVGACNVTDDGRVLVSVFNLSGLRSNDQLLTVNFEPVSTASGTAVFTLSVNTAVSLQGSRLPAIADTTAEVELTRVEYGSLTGDVTDNESTAGLFALDVCVAHDETLIETCTKTSGLGSWRVDDLAVGTYTVVVTDPAGVYAAAATSGTVSADHVAAGIDTAMVIATTSDETGQAGNPSPEDDGETNPPISRPTGPNLQTPGPTVVVYGASISGQVNALDTGQPIEAIQVCATQPLVLHQSCATTTSDGTFALVGLSTGNYWVTIVDPIGRFEEVRPKLVGVVGDDVVRAGVQIRLTRIAE